MSLPSSLLSATNRQLRDEVERAAARVREVRAVSAEQRSALAQMHDGLRQLARHERVLQAAVTQTRTRAQQDHDALQRLRGEVAALTQHATSLQRTQAQLQQRIAQGEAAATQQRRALAAARAQSDVLGDEVRALVQAQTPEQQQQQHHGAGNTAGDTSPSRRLEAMWRRLARLQGDVVAREAAVAAAAEAHACVLRDIAQARTTLQQSVDAQRDSAVASAQVRAQAQQLDDVAAARGAAVAQLTTALSHHRALRDELQRTHAALTSEQQQLQQQHDAQQRARAAAQSSRRACVHALRASARTRAALQRRHAAVQQHLRTLRAALDGACAACDECAATMQQQRQQMQQRQQQQQQQQQHDVTNAPSSSSLYALQSLAVTLQRRAAAASERVLRTRQRVAQAVAALGAAAAQRDDVDVALSRAHADKAAAQARLREAALSVAAAAAAQQRIAAALQAQQARVQSALATAAEQRERASASARTDVDALRTLLHAETRRWRQLDGDVRALRVAVTHGDAARQRDAATLHTLQAHGADVAREVTALHSELAQTATTRQTLTQQCDVAAATRARATAAADAHTTALQEMAGVGERARADAQRVDGELQARAHRATLALHLERAALHDSVDELQRRVRRRDLLRTRYAEAVQSLVRVTNATTGRLADEECMSSHRSGRGDRVGGAASGGDGGGSAPADMQRRAIAAAAAAAAAQRQQSSLRLLGDAADADAASLEALHAQCLLQRSCVREQLMERGSYLDMRICALEKETQTLQRMHAELQRATAIRPRTHDQQDSDDSRRRRQDGSNDDGRGGAATSSSVRGDTSSAADDKDAWAPTQLLRAEVALQHDAMTALRDHRERLRARQQQLCRELQTLQDTARRKKLQLARARDALRRCHNDGGRGEECTLPQCDVRACRA